MPIFFDLGRQRAASDHVVLRLEKLSHLIQQRLAQPVPLDRRIFFRMGDIEQLTIFDKQQAVGYYFWNSREIFIDTRWKYRAIQEFSSVPGNLQTRLRFLAIGYEKALRRELAHAGRKPCLGTYLEAVFRQITQHFGQAAVAHAYIIGPGLREKCGFGWIGSAFLDFPAQILCQLRKVMRLVGGSSHFQINQENHDTGHSKKQDQKGKSKKLERAPQSETIRSRNNEQSS